MKDRAPPLREVCEIAREDQGFKAGARCVPDEVLRRDADEGNRPAGAPVLADVAQRLLGCPERRSMMDTEKEEIHDVGERAMVGGDQIGEHDLTIRRKQPPPSADPRP